MRKYYTKETKWIPSTGRDIKILIYRPVKNKKPKEKTPGILWIHGGGYITGMPEMIHITRGIALVKKYGAIVVTPEYRLAKESSYPSALEDCYVTLKYIKEHADELGINSSQIMVGGESAGGGLTAAICMYARDKGEVNVAFQMPIYPMIDHRDTESSKDNHAPIWNTRTNHYGWKKYLGDLWQKDDVPVYASPARETDYSNLPPAYTFVGDIEPFYCETLAFVDNLNKAGVNAKVDVYHKWFHGYDLVLPFKKISKKAIAKFEDEFVYATEHYFSEQTT